MKGRQPSEPDRQALRAWMRQVMAARKWSAREWADKARTSPSNITRFLRKPDAAMPSLRTMTKLASVAPIPPPAVNGNGAAAHIGNTPDLPIAVPVDSEYDPVAALEIRPGMGGGGFEDLTDATLVLFPRRLIRDQLRARPEEMRVVEVEGPSMSPMLESGDQVLVNLAKRNPSQPGVFCLWDGFGIVCKMVERISRTDPPMVRVISVNPLFKTEEIPEEDAHIMGRVVWFARRL